MVLNEIVIDTFFGALKEFLTETSLEKAEIFFEDKILCTTIFGGLTNTNKNLILYVLLLENKNTLLLSELNKILNKIDKSIFDTSEILKELTNLKIVRQRTSGTLNELIISEMFIKNLKISLLGNDNSVKRPSSCDSSSAQPLKTMEFLDTYFKQRWEFLLSLIAEWGRNNIDESLSKELLSILLLSGILILSNSNEISNYDVNISSYGFKFLLLDRRGQILTLIFHTVVWLNLSKDIPIHLSVTFIASLSQYTVGQPIPIPSDHGENYSLLIKVLREIGLIYMRKSTTSIFYTTRIAESLISSRDLDEIDSTNDLASIIVESNFRIYAYNISPLQLSLIGLFSEILYLFPSMVVSKITRESAYQAFSFGISSEQILFFVDHYSEHFKKLKNIKRKANIPFSVSDQLKLWEKQRNRLQWTEGVLYKGFNTVSDFEDVLDFTINNNCVVLYNKNKRFIVVTNEGHPDIKRFWKDRK
uniref:General transcription factor IIH subunit 4 n=1 Tax=Henneguya salminicola TaxID=69463 RepID=A0A6G3MEN7_HENSL